MDGADPASASVSGIPALFANYVEITTIGEKKDLEIVVRRLAAGDPPDRATVVTPAPPRLMP
jgi:hypothetical protein